jgi:hypothetical protein
VGGDHHVRRVEELDNRFDGQTGARRWQSEKHHILSHNKLLPLGHQGARSLKADAKYDMVTTPSLSLAAGGGGEEDAGTSSSDEGRSGRQA